MPDTQRIIASILLALLWILAAGCGNPLVLPTATPTVAPATMVPAVAETRLTREPSLVLVATPAAAPVWPPSLAGVPRITPQALKDKLDAGQDVVVVDARTRTAYKQGHIPGAVSMSLAEIVKRYEELSRDRELILYCT